MSGKTRDNILNSHVEGQATIPKDPARGKFIHLSTNVCFQNYQNKRYDCPEGYIATHGDTDRRHWPFLITSGTMSTLYPAIRDDPPLHPANQDTLTSENFDKTATVS